MTNKSQARQPDEFERAIKDLIVAVSKMEATKCPTFQGCWHVDAIQIKTCKRAQEKLREMIMGYGKERRG